MAINRYPTILQPIVDGEQVRARVANRMPGQLGERTDYLKAILDAIEAGKALVLRDVAFGPDVATLNAVYWDVDNLRYDRALAAAETDAVSGSLVPAPTSYCVGICLGNSVGRGDLLLMGAIQLSSWTNLIDSSGQTPTDAGPWYLSASTPGELVKQRPPVGIFVAYFRGDGTAHIMPSPKDLLEGHIHYALDLVASPAGVVNCALPDSIYEFVSSDADTPGWLPADHPSFAGKAPAGAKFGYNIAAHPALRNVWPPVPLESAYLEADGIGVAGNRWSADVNGIWWYENCFGKAPWPSREGCEAPGPGSLSSSSSEVCDSGDVLEEDGYVRVGPYSRRLKISFVKMTAKTNTSVVTYLEGAAPIFVHGCDTGVPANYGRLRVGIDLSLSTTDESTPSPTGLKSVSGTAFRRGPLVSRLRAGSNISITPVPGTGFFSDPNYWGELEISAIVDGGTVEDAAQFVALDRVRPDRTDDVFYLTFPQAIQSGMRMRVFLPRQGLPASAKMAMWFWILNLGSGSLPDLSCSYRRLPRPGASCAVEALPTVDTALPDLDLSGCSPGLNEYVEVESDSFDVADGDCVFFTLQRAVDVIPADCGVIRMGYRVFAGA